MKTSSEGFQQCYNAQVAVDGEHQLVVATDLTAKASDQGGLPALLDDVAETFGEQPETVLADAGYSNERDLADLETRRVEGYVAPGREGKTAATRDLKNHPATGRMVEKLATPAGRAAYAERKWLSEAPNGFRRTPAIPSVDKGDCHATRTPTGTTHAHRRARSINRRNARNSA